MDIYKESYLLLFNAITDARRLLLQCRMEDAVETLMEAQKNAEEKIVSAEE